ncbi:hypothetical protein [Rheinheimera sp.]|uniref:hypothetical protein n=1 Tax=Rheinheimera sp. TaxID=1869214 RepID=UPI00307D85B9
MKWGILSVLYLSLALHAQEQPQLLIPKPRSEYDINHQYYVSLLDKALRKAANGRPVPRLVASYQMEQGRALRELAKGEVLDVFWVGTDQEKEHQFRAIRIPLERGLMGFRKMTLHKDKQALFDTIHSLQGLQRLTACQGAYWPDVSIMRTAGLKVLEAPVYENIFKQINAGRCDYFPRGLHEGLVELQLRHSLYPNLVRYPDLMLHYPFTVYFFTQKQHEALAQWIEQGLEAMIDDGELLAHMQQSELTRQMFPLSQQAASRWLLLKNPLLSPDTDYQNPRYWFVPADFGYLQEQP